MPARRLVWCCLQPRVSFALITALGFAACGPPSSPNSAPVVVSAAADPGSAEAQPSHAAFAGGKLLQIGGGPALGCEARAVGQWVKLSCAGLSYFGAFPWHVSAYTYAGDGAATDAQKIAGRNQVSRQQQMGQVSIVWRHAPGTHLEAAFSWFPYMLRFRASRSADPQPGVGELPTPLGEFVSAPAGTAKELIRAVCACPPRRGPGLLLSGYDCESESIDADAYDAWDPVCLRHMQGADACQDMNECLTLEPSHFKACSPDEVKSGGHPMTGCYKTCSSDLDCSEDFRCTASLAATDGELVPGPTACFPAEDSETEHLVALSAYLKSTGAPGLP